MCANKRRRDWHAVSRLWPQHTLGRECASNPSNVRLLPNEGRHGYRGRPRPRTSLPRTPDSDLKQTSMRLKTRAKLEQLLRIAMNKTKWRKLHIQCKRSYEQVARASWLQQQRNTLITIIIDVHMHKGV